MTSGSVSTNACPMHGRMSPSAASGPRKAPTAATWAQNASRSPQSLSLRNVMRCGMSTSRVCSRPKKTQSRGRSLMSTCFASDDASLSSTTTQRRTRWRSSSRSRP